jgi:hypothetical protein
MIFNGENNENLWMTVVITQNEFAHLVARGRKRAGLHLKTLHVLPVQLGGFVLASFPRKEKCIVNNNSVENFRSLTIYYKCVMKKRLK